MTAPMPGHERSPYKPMLFERKGVAAHARLTPAELKEEIAARGE
jgi:hypothetical protein